MYKRKYFSKRTGKVASTCKSRVRSVELGAYQSRETWKVCVGHEMMDDAGRREHKEDHLLPVGFSGNRCWDGVWSSRYVLGMKLGKQEQSKRDWAEGEAELWHKLKSFSQPPGSLEPLFSIRASWIRPEWIFQPLLNWSSGVGGLHLGLAGLLQLRLTLSCWDLEAVCGPVTSYSEGNMGSTSSHLPCHTRVRRSISKTVEQRIARLCLRAASR